METAKPPVVPRKLNNLTRNPRYIPSFVCRTKTTPSSIPPKDTQIASHLLPLPSNYLLSTASILVKKTGFQINSPFFYGLKHFNNLIPPILHQLLLGLSSQNNTPTPPPSTKRKSVEWLRVHNLEPNCLASNASSITYSLTSYLACLRPRILIWEVAGMTTLPGSAWGENCVTHVKHPAQGLILSKWRCCWASTQKLVIFLKTNPHMPYICSKSLINLYCQEDGVQNPAWSLLEQILPMWP